MKHLLAIIIALMTATVNAKAAATVDTNESAVESLYDYAFIICLESMYKKNQPQPKIAIKLLSKEAWVLVEKGSYSGEVYNQLYNRSKKYAAETTSRMVIGSCLKWKQSKELSELTQKITK